jgi:hypothetical protein
VKGADVQRTINDVRIHCVEHGAGIPLVALHGSGVDHREIAAAVEAVVRSTGLPKDLPSQERAGSVSADAAASPFDES